MILRAISLCLAAALSLAAAETKLLRHPTYHKGRVAFSYLGDIWAANDDGTGVERLTVHKARDVYPRFSPDGKWIAFSSNRYGNYDVFVMPATGGQPRQLTFNSASDIVTGWTPDSTRVVFQSSRGAMFPGIPNLYEVPLDGGVETMVPTDWGYWGSYSADGKKFAFNRHPMVWSRKHYRGSYAADLWVMDVAAKTYTNLSAADEYKGNWFWPMYGARGEVFFVADKLPNEKAIKPGSREVLRSINNIWKISEKGGRPVQVTKHTDGNLFYPSISADGRVIVYEENFGLWKLDTATGRTAEIPIRITSDDKDNFLETVSITGDAESFSLSPSTKRAVISTRGELFTIATDRGEVSRVTESPWREQEPQWSPDGKWIAFGSDRTGREEIWIADERGNNLKKLSDSNTDKSNIRWAPDSKSLLYTGSDKKLYRVGVDGSNTSVIASSEAGAPSNAQFSPDGQWISYTKMDNSLRPHVWVVPAGGGQERQIRGYNTFSETGARWTPDGRKIVFLGGLAQMGSATLRQTTLNLYSVSLLPDEKNPSDRSIDSEEAAVAAEQSQRPRMGARPAGEGSGAPTKVEVKIDWSGLERRARRLTRLADNVMVVVPSPDSRLYAFVTMGEQDGRFVSALYTVGEDGQRVTRIAQAAPASAEGEERPRGGGFGGGISMPQFSKDGRSIFYKDGNRIYSAGVPASAGTDSPSPVSAFASSRGGRGGSGASSITSAEGERRPLMFSIRMDVDRRAEWKQVFEESWRVMRNRFYDPEMHGVDWSAMMKVYEPLVEFAGDQEEVHNVINQMIGELNASHTGISGGSFEPGAASTRHPGFEIETDSSGYYKVACVYKEGPADHDYTRVKPGNYVLAINGKPLKSGENYWKHYNSAPGRTMEFTLNSKPSMDGAWKAKIEPLSSMAYSTLQYERWVDERRAIVDKLSGGRVGYVHIRQMNAESLRRFEREMVENTFKKALIIDQRFNPGGGIDQELLEILGQRQYQKTRGRDSVEITRPQRAFFGPMVVMQNERSTSDAEVFPDGFRTLGLGKVVGVTTYGAVIGTGAHRLMDGSSIRTPGTGLWNVKGYNLENYGVPPDVYVDNTPADWLKGRDAQVEKAVEVLLAQIK